MLLERLHSVLMRGLYSVLAPRHPRGSTDMHAVIESPQADTLWVHTHGLAKRGLPELEIVGVPERLRGYAHGILFDVMGYMASRKSIGSDEHFGGLLVGPEQRVVHYATARRVTRPDDSEHDGFLRFVDYNERAESGFPTRLFAAHIAALADRERSATTRERLARLSLEVYKGSPAEWMRESDSDRNPGNWLALDVLAHALYDQGDATNGEICFRSLIERCPAAAVKIRAIYAEGIAEGHLPPPDVDPRSRFWTSLDEASLQHAIEERQWAG